MSRRLVVSVIGDGFLDKDSAKYQFAYDMGEALVSAGYRVMSGGLSGVMEAAFAGAHASPVYRDGDTIAVLPGNNPDEANRFADIVIASGLDHARNFIVANSDAVIAVGGGAGTLSELSYAWVMKRLILAYRVPWAKRSSLQFTDWSAVVADKKLDDKVRYPEFEDDRIFGVNSAREAISLLTEKMPKYNQRPKQAGKREI